MCVLAQKEIRDLSQDQCKKFAAALKAELAQLKSQRVLNGCACEDILVAKIIEVDQMLKQFEIMSNTARCTSGYRCASPCKFSDGIHLDSLV